MDESRFLRQQFLRQLKEKEEKEETKKKRKVEPDEKASKDGDKEREEKRRCLFSQWLEHEKHHVSDGR